MEQQSHSACEWTKSKQKENQPTSHSNWPRVLLFDLAHRECNGILVQKVDIICVSPLSKITVNYKKMVWLQRNFTTGTFLANFLDFDGGFQNFFTM